MNTSIDPLDEHRAIALARFMPNTFLATGNMIERGYSDNRIIALTITGNFDPKLTPVLCGAIRHIRRQLAGKRSL